jgi:hypothetical protein
MVNCVVVAVVAIVDFQGYRRIIVACRPMTFFQGLRM